MGGHVPRAPKGILIAVVLAACSSSSSAPSAGLTAGAATVDNTFPFMPAHYSASVGATPTGSGAKSIVMTSLRGTSSCSTAQLASENDVAQVFRVSLTLDPEVLAPGRYALGNGWHATYRMADAACAAVGEGDATKGTLEIDGVGASIAGIADMTFAGGRVIASFNAAPCDFPKTAGGSPACTQVPACPEGNGANVNPTPTVTCNGIP